MNGDIETALTAWAQSLGDGAPHDFGTEDAPLILPSISFRGLRVALLRGLAAGFAPEHAVPVVIFSGGDVLPDVGALYYAPLQIAVVVPVSIAGVVLDDHSALLGLVRSWWNDGNRLLLSQALADYSLACDGYYLQGFRDSSPVDAWETTITFRLGIRTL